jgi:hypothetical protein
MPKNKIPSNKATRQAINRNAKASVKQATKNAKAAAARARKSSSAAQRSADALRKDTLARWRTLEKLGASPTRTKPSLKGINARNSRSIRDAFAAIQNEGWYETGRVRRPFHRVTKQTKRGESYVYELTENFKFLRTKKKATRDKKLIKTKKGYIVPSPSDAKVRINKKGQVITTYKGMEYNDETYTGEEVLELYRKVKDGEIKVSERNMIVWRPFGGFVTSQDSSNEDFIERMNLYARVMNSRRFQEFMETTVFSFGHMSND